MTYPCTQSRKPRSCGAEAPEPAGPCSCGAVLLSIVSLKPNPSRMRTTTDPWMRNQAPPTTVHPDQNHSPPKPQYTQTKQTGPTKPKPTSQPGPGALCTGPGASTGPGAQARQPGARIWVSGPGPWARAAGPGPEPRAPAPLGPGPGPETRARRWGPILGARAPGLYPPGPGPEPYGSLPGTPEICSGSFRPTKGPFTTSTGGGTYFRQGLTFIATHTHTVSCKY